LQISAGNKTKRSWELNQIEISRPCSRRRKRKRWSGQEARQPGSSKAMAVKKSSQKEIERAVKRRPAGIYQLPKAFGQELDMRRGNVLGKKVRLQMLRDSRKKKTRNVKSSKTTGPKKK